MWKYISFIMSIVVLQNIIQCLELIPERAIIDNCNEKYIKSPKVIVRQKGRNKPRQVDMDINIVKGLGNNLTAHLSILECLSGRCQNSVLEATYRLCDFLSYEPFLGIMLAKQIKGNWSCPFKPGQYHFHDVLLLGLDQFPFYLPVTFDTVTATIRANLRSWMIVNKVEEEVFRFHIYATLTQKPKRIDSRRKRP